MDKAYPGIVVRSHGREEGFRDVCVLAVGAVRVEWMIPSAIALPAGGGSPVVLYEGGEAMAWRVVEEISKALAKHEREIVLSYALRPGVGG